MALSAREAKEQNGAKADGENNATEPFSKESSPQSPINGVVGDSSATFMGPPQSVETATIYRLYRGVVAEVDGRFCRVWANFPALQLCWAGYDQPAREFERASLLDLSDCRWETITIEDALLLQMDIFGARSSEITGAISGTSTTTSPPLEEKEEDRAIIRAIAERRALLDFAQALKQLLTSYQSEGSAGMIFIQSRLFQYLWMHQSHSRTDEETLVGQAVLAFNIDPKEGVKYIRDKLAKRTDDEVGRWLAQLATDKGGLDPTMLGSYFSRKDTLEVFKSFVRCLDFAGVDVVVALRRLFDTFKPGGEGQVIERILDLFSEAYYLQWKVSQDGAPEPRTAYGCADSICQVAVSLIMLNTGIHVAAKKVGKSGTIAMMTVEDYIKNTRQVVSPEEVPEDALRNWYDSVRDLEISVEPLPRVAFSKLPVQPDIEGWLMIVFSPQRLKRYWAVLALQRLYLFSDANDVEPADAIDLKDMRACAVWESAVAMQRFREDSVAPRGSCLCRPPRQSLSEPLDPARAFEVSQTGPGSPTMMPRLSASNPRSRLAFVAESPDLMEKWVSLISSGPY